MDRDGAAAAHVRLEAAIEAYTHARMETGQRVQTVEQLAAQRAPDDDFHLDEYIDAGPALVIPNAPGELAADDAQRLSGELEAEAARLTAELPRLDHVAQILRRENEPKEVRARAIARGTNTYVHAAYVAVAVAVALWGAVVIEVITRGSLRAVAGGMWIAAGVALVAALVLSAIPIARVGDARLFSAQMSACVWTDVALVLMPVFGTVYLVKFAVTLFQGDTHDPWDTVTQVDGDIHRKYYIGISFIDGEGAPLALLYLLIAALTVTIPVLLFAGFA